MGACERAENYSPNNLFIWSISPNMVIFSVQNIWRLFRGETHSRGEEVRYELAVSPIE